MEFLNLVLIFVTASVVIFTPRKENLAFSIVVVSVLLMVVLFAIGTRTSFLPAVNF